MSDVIRLLPAISSGWSLYPAWEDRVVRFNRAYLSETTDSQTAAMVQTLRERWIKDPLSSGYWLAMKDGQPVGHACGWLSFDWNVPYAFIYQMEAQTGYREEWVKQLDEWVDEMNGALGARGLGQVGFVEFATFNDPKSMKRLLQAAGRQNIRYRATLRFDA